ncbi:succinate-acetate transporter protein [Kitasatospora sp. MAP12-15]|uniref:acetate uptake transporter n=1 Tax=unclassified Kitasatospora TaxID=2633591 RepID=UPI002473F50A|nr:acetate uptake transporter [Kitasatospora sp. MAP12-44]MDH6115274.1 succinate-acetate transporter protein [Kitasatospora sp. MAP12-44]
MATQPSAPSTAAAEIADPAPLGLAGFAMTTFVLSCFNADLLDAKLGAVVLPLALVYGGLAQLLAGMWEFRKGNTFGATAFSSYGAFWLSYYFLVKTVLPSLGDDPHTHQAVGLFLLGWTIFTAYMTVAALRVSGAVLAVFASLTVTFALLAAGAFGSSDSVTRIGGWFGLLTALLAWYASFAGVTAFTFKRSILPTWPAR